MLNHMIMPVNLYQNALNISMIKRCHNKRKEIKMTEQEIYQTLETQRIEEEEFLEQRRKQRLNKENKAKL